jgi:hypothetical protein
VYIEVVPSDLSNRFVLKSIGAQDGPAFLSLAATRLDGTVVESQQLRVLG